MSSLNRNIYMPRAFAMLACCAMVLTISARAAEPAPTPAAKAEVMTDAEFLMKAAQIDMAEVQLGKLAHEKGGSADVKDFAKHMHADHEKNTAELHKLAGRMKVEMPKALDVKHQELFDKLQKLSGKAFDEEYIKAMVDGHKDAVNLFESSAKNAQNQDVRGFAANTLPKLQEHLRMAQNAQAKMASSDVKQSGASSTGTGSSSEPSGTK